MTSISNALKVIVNLKCFENKDILESDTTIILASYVMISDKDCDETFIKGIFDFQVLLFQCWLNLLTEKGSVMAHFSQQYYFCLRFSKCDDFCVLSKKFHLTPCKKTLCNITFLKAAILQNK